VRPGRKRHGPNFSPRKIVMMGIHIRTDRRSQGPCFVSVPDVEGDVPLRSASTDPAYADWTISAIAFDAGFGDLSYFNRAFRRHYGETPSAVRGR
jgi:AraC-like DNA-binding protein